MKEISKLFQTKDIDEIKKLLESVINKIESSQYEEKEILLKDLIKNAQKANKKLRKQCEIFEGVFIYPETVAPLALLTEEICTDFKNKENILGVLRFNLDNYFKEFKAVGNDDWRMDVKTIIQALLALKEESSFFEALKLQDIKISIVMMPARFKSLDIEVINYNEVINKDFTIHCFYLDRPDNKQIDNFEACLDQFGIILKNILMRRFKESLKNFWDLFDGLDDTEKTDVESDKFTMSFANMFSHYIIEKMAVRVKKVTGEFPDGIDKDRDENFVESIVKYYDEILDKLVVVKEKEEFKGEELCPCRSGKTYKNCCKKKKMKYYKADSENTYIKEVPMDDELNDMLIFQMSKFKQLFGRAPLGDDYILGGTLYKDVKRVAKITKRKEMVDKAWLYACERTDRIITKDTLNVLPDNEIENFNNFMNEYRELMAREIEDNKCNTLQAVDCANSILEHLIGNRVNDIIYVLNLFVNFYCQNNQTGEDFVIHNIKDFLVFCAYKTSTNIKALKSLVDQQYYDSSMAVVRILYEILISVRAYKNDAELFKEKVLSVVGLQEGTHQKIDKNTIQNIETKQIYKFEIQKRQLAQKAGSNYIKLYDVYYRELSEFIHLDTSTARDMFSYNDLFLDIDECLIARFIGAIFSLQIIRELIDFEGSVQIIDKDLTYFSNMLLLDFKDVLNLVINIDNKEIYTLLMETLNEYNDKL